jgi:hypothetical protein
MEHFTSIIYVIFGIYGICLISNTRVKISYLSFIGFIAFGITNYFGLDSKLSVLSYWGILLPIIGMTLHPSICDQNYKWRFAFLQMLAINLMISVYSTVYWPYYLQLILTIRYSAIFTNRKIINHHAIKAREKGLICLGISVSGYLILWLLKDYLTYGRSILIVVEGIGYGYLISSFVFMFQ